MGCFSRYTHHDALAQPAIALTLTALSLLLLVLVLLSVPGPIKGLYWFSVASEQSGEGNLSAGVLGWCGMSLCFSCLTNTDRSGCVETDTSNCTYAPLS